MPDDPAGDQRGRHPSAHERYRPRPKKIALVRGALEPFGLAPNDNRIWSGLAPVFLAIAQRYNFRNDKGAVPRPGQVKQSLDRVEKAHEQLKKWADKLVAAIGAVDNVALEWMLAYDDPAPLFARGRADAEGPCAASDEFKRLRDRVFESEFEEYDRLASESFQKAASAPRGEDLDNAGRGLIAARAQLELAFSRQFEFGTGSPERADADRQISESLRALEQKERDFRLASLRVGGWLAPSPHFFRDGLKDRVDADLKKSLERVPPIGALAAQARDRFSAASPEDKGGFGPLFLGKSAKYRMAEECCEILLYVFGIGVLRQIQGGKEGTFAGLLRALHEYATNKEPSGDDFREILDNKIGDLHGHLEGLLRATKPAGKERPVEGSVRPKA